ncbi:MAG: hypothetical protein AB1589_02330 [Cyanobacteriota bacterium]
MLNSSNNPPEQQHRFQYLQQLLNDHPFVFCGGLWVTLVALGGLAILGLVNAGPIEPEASLSSSPVTTFQKAIPLKKLPKSQPKPIEETPSPFVQQDVTPRQDFPLWLFGAIALGCAGGSLLITHFLLQSNQSSQFQKRLRPVGTIRKKRRNPEKISRPVAREPQGGENASNNQTLKNTPAKTGQRLAQITVLPPEHSHPLDGGRENLADVMDLRKRYSLTSLMRGK